jgi:DNA-binding MarR family transcriptional regulator
MDQTEFRNEVTKVERRKNSIGQKRLTEHKLWLQLKACSRDEGHALQQLDKAWERAIENRMNQGFRTTDDLIAYAVERAYQWDDRLTEGKDGLPDNEALAMSYVIAFIEKRQMSRVTCPAREVGEFANIPKSTAHRALKSLTEKGFLVQFSRGTWSKKPGNRKAAIYGLGDPLNLRYGGRGGPSTQAYAYKHFVEGRDSPDWEWVHHRGVCIWGQGLAPAPFTSWPLSIGT